MIIKVRVFSTRMKSGLIREVTFGERGLIKRFTMKSGLIREVTFGERGLIKRFTTSPPL
jgi:hypothetical protein